MINSREDTASVSQPTPTPGPFLARVVSHQDSSYMGMLEVEILRPVGSAGSSGQLHQVKYMSPFYGVTSIDYVQTDPNDYNTTQKSYGMWMIPPDPGTQVVVIFIDGDPKRGYWIGCVQDEGMNFMVPGIAATSFKVGDDTNRIPVAEYNKKINAGSESSATDTTKFKKPRHPFATVLENQGLLNDDVRGITTSSARRETPSSVFGISTPGPLDKGENAQRGAIGKADHQIASAPVSRLGGTTFVMDDGDDKFLRTTLPYGDKAGGPVYAAVEKGETGGLVGIPHNELVRLRTRTGHQILMHNSEDLIYIGNARGTAWIEMTSAGKIDIFSTDSISIYSENDLNFTAKRDINLTSHAGNINLNAFLNLKASAEKNIEIKANEDGKITVVKTLNLKSNHHVETAGKIDMNGPTADAATVAPLAARTPMREPWWAHENLDPLSFIPKKTVAIQPSDSNTRDKIIKSLITVPKEPPKQYKKYANVEDTFAKVKGED